MHDHLLRRFDSQPDSQPDSQSDSASGPGLLQYIETSMAALETVRKILQRGNLTGLAHAMAVFQTAFDAVRQHISAFENNLTDTEAGRLRQLTVLHHKVMRATATKMQHVQEDIQVIEHASSQLHRTAEIAAVNGKR